jgi:O-antigen/teichoic acid export membrane protein
MVAAYAVTALMIFQRIYLPMFARLQADKAALGAVVERVIWGTNAISAPLASLTLALFDPFTTIVFGPKWLAARTIFRLLWVANLFVPTSTPLLGLLSALGHSRVALSFAVVWMVGTWLVGAPMIFAYGGIGFAVANVVVQFSNIVLTYVAKSKVSFSVLPTIFPSWTLAGGVGALAFFIQNKFPADHLSHLMAYLLGGLLLYVGGLFLFDGRSIRSARALVSVAP